MRQRHALTLLVVVATGLLANCSSVSPEALDEQGGAATAASDRRLIVTLKLTNYAEQMRELASRELDIAGVDANRGEVDLVVLQRDADQLKGEGFTILHVQDPGAVAPDPDLNRWMRPDTVASAIRGYAERHPTLANAVTIGRSSDGREIMAMRITKDADAPHSPAKPTILFNSMHHARELMTAEVGIDTIDVLLERYGTDPKVTHWVDANEIWVVPMLNVDGNNQVWTNDKFWRKNTHGCPASGTCPRGTGVDINRNYPYAWNSCRGSSSSASADDFHGTAAASEPETQAMISLVERVRPVFDISYHSYSEMVLYPYGCRGVYAPTRALFEDIGKKMARALPSDDGVHTYTAGTPWELLYGVDGGDIDWMFHDYSVAAFGIELSGRPQGFQPSYSLWRDKTVVKARISWQMLLDRLDGSAVRGVARSSTGQIQTGAQVDIVAASGPSANQTRVVNPDGSFHVVLLPGEYDVTVRVAGSTHAPFTRHVTIGDARVDLDAVVD